MGYKSLVTNSVKKAFKSIGDLAESVTLSKHGASTFDFATNQVTAGTATSTTIKGVLIEKRKSIGGKEANGTKEMQYIFPASDLSDPSIYDTITTASGAIWSIVPPHRNDGYLITIDVRKEA